MYYINTKIAMDFFDDIIFICLLLLCLIFGYFYKQIKNKGKKKWIGTSIGLLMVLAVSGFRVWQFLLMFLVNAGIILHLSKRYCHLVSFAFSFSYLFFLRTTTKFGNPFLPYQTTLIEMMMTLKLVGLAFEINSGYLLKKNKNDEQKTDEEILEDNSNYINPNFTEMFHYTFSYLGVLTGPYYRYRTFSDYFTVPFAHNAPWKEETAKRLAYVFLCFLLYVLSSYAWPISYALTDEFYTQRSWLYRFWYVWPSFFIFRMRVYGGLLLSESLYTIAGFGAYPTISKSKPGLGPSKCFKEMNEIAKNPIQLVNVKYDFKTIHCIDPYTTEVCTTVRDTTKDWNICVQYWLVVTVYKRFPHKKLRTIATLLVSAFWHGIYTGYYVCISSVPFYLAVEDVYVHLFLKNNNGMSLKIWEWIIWFVKMQMMAYLGIAYQLLGFQEIVRYYSSIYYCGFIAPACLYIVGLLILKAKKPKVKNIADIQSKEIRKIMKINYSQCD